MNKWICDECNNDLYNHFVLNKGQKLSQRACIESPTCMRKNYLAIVENQWISVADQFPKDNQFVLVIDKENEIWTAQWTLAGESNNESNPERRFWSFKVDNEDCCECTWPKLDNTVTHWRPLPELPKDKE